MTGPFPILQFGTSRFLQAHADLFVSEALGRGEALGPIAVVQTTTSPASAARVAALVAGGGYPVRIRGLVDGRPVDTEVRGTAIGTAFAAERDWEAVRRVAVEDAAVILSNTGERGFDLHPEDGPGLVAAADRVPRSFPAKLAVLLFERWQRRPDAPLSLFPCELVTRNGDVLRDCVRGLAADWRLPEGFERYLSETCRWANALVDRIVSAPIEPVGAVAEPYALWEIERQAGLCLPCRHPAIVETDDLSRFERLKLHLLNLGHTLLAEEWLLRGGSPDLLVREAMADPALRAPLEGSWAEEVLPVFGGWGLGAEAVAYLATIRERFANPFLDHRLSDIAANHAAKKRLRLGPVVAAADALGLGLAQPRLRAALARES